MTLLAFTTDAQLAPLEGNLVPLTLLTASGLRESTAYINRHLVEYIAPSDKAPHTNIYFNGGFVIVKEQIDVVAAALEGRRG